MQYPLRLAWAITIHKSQGLTFEHAIIDASHSFTHGQTYVALSRCKTLEGMVLSQPLSRGAIISSQTVDAFTSQLAAPSQEQISSLELQYIIYCISELFDFYSIRASYEHLMRCLVEFFARESCGWCTPCRDGLPWSVKILRALERGEGQPGDIETLEQLCRFLGPGKTFCAHAPGAVEPLQSAIKYFREEFEAGIKQPFSNTHLINGIQPNLLKERW